MRSVPDLFWKYSMLEKPSNKEVRNSINRYLMSSKISSVNNYKNEESFAHKSLNISILKQITKVMLKLQNKGKKYCNRLSAWEPLGIFAMVKIFV
jgi:hypothetical protein